MGRNKRKYVEDDSSSSSASSEDEEKLRLRLKVKKLQKKLKRKRTARPNIEDRRDSMSENSDLLNENVQTGQAGQSYEQVDMDPLFIEEEGSTLPQHVLYILGQDNSVKPIVGESIHQDLAVQWENILTGGLQEDSRKALIDKYPSPENCLLLAAPKVNPEAKVASPEAALKRDERLQSVQSQIGASLAALGKLLTQLLATEEKEEGANLESIGLVGDACRLLSDLHFQQSEVRRGLLSLQFNKDLREVLTEVKGDVFLFGKDLGERIKNAKAMERSGLDLKAKKVAFLPQTSKPSPQHLRQGNFRAPSRRPQSSRLGGQTGSAYRGRSSRDSYQMRKPERKLVHSSRTYGPQYHKRQK